MIIDTQQLGTAIDIGPENGGTESCGAEAKALAFSPTVDSVS